MDPGGEQTLQDLADLLQTEQASQLARAGIRAHAAKPRRQEHLREEVLDAAGPSLVVPTRG